MTRTATSKPVAGLVFALALSGRLAAAQERRCYTRTAAVVEGLGGVDCNGDAGSWWSGRSLISMKPEVCDGFGYGVMRTFASACLSRRRAGSFGHLPLESSVWSAIENV